jgi:hypothetical protein
LTLKKLRAAQNNSQESIDKWRSVVELYKSTASPTVRIYIAKAKDLVDQIQQLSNQAEMPSKSAAHSNWKNDIKQQMIELDRERLNLLSKAISEGYNPDVSFNGRTDKLSVFVEEQKKTYADESDIKPVQNKSNLRLIKKPTLTIVE